MSSSQSTISKVSSHVQETNIQDANHDHPLFDFYTPMEELANTITHGLGAVLSGAGVIYFLWVPTLWHHKLIFGIFGIGLLISYVTSTLYHGAPHGLKKHRLRLMDHASIYINIAGSYTPYLVLAGVSWLSSVVLFFIWLVAIAGACFKLFVPDIDRFESYAVLSYLAMGWLFPLLVWDVYPNLPPHTLTWLVIGGIIYTSGIGFYRWESLPYNHAIWHVFVMVAAVCHFWAAQGLYLAIAVKG